MNFPGDFGSRPQRGPRRPSIILRDSRGVPLAARERPAPSSELASMRYRPPADDRRPEPPRSA